jgi:hypothetical protein
MLSVAAATNPPSEQTQTVALEYREVDYVVTSWHVPMSVKSAPFRREPALGKARILRGTFHLAGVSNEMAFIWDKSAGKLHLDLNRNADLSDDKGGVFESPDWHTAEYATFTNVHLSFLTSAGSSQCLADLTLFDRGRWKNCSAGLRFCWQGRLVLGSEEWQVGVVGNPFESHAGSPLNQHLLLRPWTERDKSFNTYSGSPETIPFTSKVFFRNHALLVDCTNQVRGGDFGLQLQITEQHPMLGELKITGSYIQRVILGGSAYTVLLDQPSGIVRVPVDDYVQPKIWVKNGNAEARCDSASRRLSVQEKEPAELVAGGPLTNSVSVTRRGRSLRLDYKVIGAGGDVYQLATQDRSHPPTFAVYKADRQIGSGRFEFG